MGSRFQGCQPQGPRLRRSLSKYYRLSQDWTHADAPDYHDRNSFSKTWLTASDAEKALIRNRQARTATAALWALNAAMKALAKN